ncbi:hypothetical protein [Qaidamihabitans albus]|uniref:hypothetical protein n=1 Tax=Qaidamihabitans albus TaxID=2795733 RepID=UPI0018F160EF|nr:hypothetical protein [Qaidamihabitans albus]
MTTTLDHTDEATVDARGAPIFLWGPGYSLTAHQVVDALGSYLATFGDNFYADGVSPLDAIHAEVVFNGDLTGWLARRSPEEIATIRARAEQVAREFFHGRFPTLQW